MTLRALCVEDDTVLADALSGEHLCANSLHTAEGTLALLDELQPDAVLIALPDPLELCREIRVRSAVPILVISTPDRVIHALESGADDALVAPVQPRELAARVRAHVRRARGELTPAHQRIDLGALVIDFSHRTVELAGVVIALTSTEFAVLAALAQHAGHPLTRESLLQLVHGRDDLAFDRSIDVHVSRLRSKLEPDPRQPRLIKTIRGHGYVLSLQPR
jgi:two-component system OmpR family response regulator